MTVAIQMDFAGATLEQYDRVLEKMGLTPGGQGPAGAISHFATKTDEGLRVVDVWESRETYEKFAREQIGPFSAEVGITGSPTLTYFDVHSYLTPGTKPIAGAEELGGLSAADQLAELDDAGMRAWDQHDPDAFVALFAGEFVWRDAYLPAPITTPDGVREYMSTWFTAFPDMRTRTSNRVVGENAIAAEITFTGTNTGPMRMAEGDLPPTGRSVVGQGCYFLRVADGKVVEFSSHPDMAGMLAQLGVMTPAPARPETRT